MGRVVAAVTHCPCSICQELALEEEEEKEEAAVSQDLSSVLRRALRVGEEVCSPGWLQQPCAEDSLSS